MTTYVDSFKSVSIYLNLYNSLSVFSRRQIGDSLLIFSRKQDLTFQANGDNLHEMSNLFFWEKWEQTILRCRLLKFLHRMLELTSAKRKSPYWASLLFLKILFTHSMLGKTFRRRHFEIFFLFISQKTDFGISCNLSPKETLCMKRQILFSGKKK